MCVISPRKKGENGAERKKKLEEIMAKNFLNFMKNILDQQIKNAQRIPNMINAKKTHLGT